MGVSNLKCGVFYHDHCFDGACSASVFTRFHRECIGTAQEFSYIGLMHRAGALFDESAFVDGENAIVDFKYYASPKITWWFDHHQSAFLSPEDGDHFRHDTSGHKFFDPAFRSCTKYIATVAREKFGYDAADLKELVGWADIIDGALYKDAQEAVDLGTPATQLTLTIEGSKGSETVQKIIRMMRGRPLAEIAADPEIQAVYQPLYQNHLRSIGIIREHSRCNDGVVYFDLVEQGIEGYNKFIPYYLFPESLYTVSVTTSPFRTKVSVGSNPWAKGPLKFNLATICERYGGGGHPGVGAISFEIGAVEQARRAAQEIAAELRS